MGVDRGQLYEFGPFRLEPDEHLLLREGKPALLTPKAFDLLLFLVRSQGRLVTKDQIMDALWPRQLCRGSQHHGVDLASLRKSFGRKTSRRSLYQDRAEKSGTGLPLR